MTVTMAVSDLRVEFGGVKALGGVSFELETGRLYGIVGPNGSGKTTMLNAISGLVPTVDGTVVVNGKDVTRLSSASRAGVGVARTFQAIRLLRDLSVLENVMLGHDSVRLKPGIARSLLGLGTRQAARSARENAIEQLERLGLTDVADRSPATLPYGVQRRVEIARALASSPSVLMLDEPVAGMNPIEKEEIAAVMKSLRGEGLTLLLVEHDLRMVVRNCDELIVLDFGKKITQGVPSVVANDPRVQEAYLGHSVANAGS